MHEQKKYYFQGKIVSQKPTEWLINVLVFEVLALLVMEEFNQGEKNG